MREAVPAKAERHRQARGHLPAIVRIDADAAADVIRRVLRLQLAVLKSIAQQEVGEFIALGTRTGRGAAVEAERALGVAKQILLFVEVHVNGAEGHCVVGTGPGKFVFEYPSFQSIRPRPGSEIELRVQGGPYERDIR